MYTLSAILCILYSVFIHHHPNWSSKLSMTVFKGVCDYESVCVCKHVPLKKLVHHRFLSFVCLCYPPLGWDLQHSSNERDMTHSLRRVSQHLWHCPAHVAGNLRAGISAKWGGQGGRELLDANMVPSIQER